jgi:hypothetical protein
MDDREAEVKTMTHHRSSAWHRTAAALLAGLLCAATSPPPAVALAAAPAGDRAAGPGSPPAAAAPRPSETVLLRFAAAAGRQIGGDERREVVAQALLAAAAAAHVPICWHGAASLGGAALDRRCAEPSQDAAPLWWDGAIAINRGAVIRVTGSLQLALGEGPPKQAPAFFLPPPIVLPRNLGEAEIEGATLRELSAQLAAMPELGEWFRRLTPPPGLQRAELAKAPAAEPPDAGGRPAAVGAASPPTPAGAAVEPPPYHPAAAAPAPAATAAEKLDAVFVVRQAVIGQGFALGVDGKLHVGATGVSFSHEGQSRPEWTIRWRDLAVAAKDEGIWDAPYPLVLRERGGTPRYLVRMDSRGHYLEGGPILAAIARGRGSSHQPEATPLQPQP